MSRAEFILSSCAGKVSFETFDQASAVVKARQRGKFKGTRSVYRCGVCRKFHIGGTPPNQRRGSK
jgi:hypothetical protein